jgi:hypothetical protein
VRGLPFATFLPFKPSLLPEACDELSDFTAEVFDQFQQKLLQPAILLATRFGLLSIRLQGL